MASYNTPVRPIPEQDPVKLYVMHRDSMGFVRDPSAPIGIFDSGIGGLTVTREIMRAMPNERLVYFGDTARLPYGAKSPETVVRFSRQIVRFLRTKGVKAVVIACNTASSHALETLAAESDVPVVGVIYAAALTAVQSTRNGRVGIIGTRGTVTSEIYRQVIHQMNPELQVFQKACPLFVPLVEEGMFHDSVTEEIASRYLQELKEKYVDTLVLGCTHYPLIRSTIQRVMGDSVTLVNPAYETAREVKEILGHEGLLNTAAADAGSPDSPGPASAGSAADAEGTQEQSRKYRFYVSDLAANFRDFAAAILPEEVKDTEKIDIEAY